MFARERGPSAAWASRMRRRSPRFDGIRMKKRQFVPPCLPILLSVLLAVAGWGLCATATARAAAAPREFRGVPWGDAIERHPELARAYSHGEQVFYRKPGDASELGGMPLEDALYVFERGRLRGARLVLTDFGDFASLKQAYISKYGVPEVRQGGGLDAYVWNWPLLRIELFHDRREGRVEAAYVHLPGMAGKDKELFQDDEEIRARGPLGFRGIRFGRDLSGLTDMIPVFGDGDFQYCRRKGENLSLGEIKLKDVLYYFYKGKFYHVSMPVARYDDFAPLKAAYFKKYGPPRENISVLNENYVWTWDDAQIALDRNETDGSVEISYAFVPVLEEAEESRATAENMAFLRDFRSLYAVGQAPGSFRGIAWGADLADAPGLEYVYSHKGVMNYRRPEERLSLGAVELGDILYSFYQDRFFYATMTVKPDPESGSDHFQALRDAYEAKYGKPRVRMTGDAENYVWAWPAMHIALIRYRDGGGVEVCYVYDPVLEEIEKQKIDRAMDALFEPFTPGEKNTARPLVESAGQ